MRSETVYAPTTSTRESIVDDLWREGWFERTSRGIVKGWVNLDADDVAAEAVITAMQAARSWDAGQGTPLDKWVKFRTRNAMIDELRRYSRYVSQLASVMPTTPLTEGGDLCVMDLVRVTASAEDEVFKRMWADTRPAIDKAISELTPKQQVIARTRMSGASQRGTGRVAARGSWPGTRYNLRMRLWSLKWMVKG